MLTFIVPGEMEIHKFYTLHCDLSFAIKQSLVSPSLFTGVTEITLLNTHSPIWSLLKSSEFMLQYIYRLGKKDITCLSCTNPSICVYCVYFCLWCNIFCCFICNHLHILQTNKKNNEFFFVLSVMYHISSNCLHWKLPCFGDIDPTGWRDKSCKGSWMSFIDIFIIHLYYFWLHNRWLCHKYIVYVWSVLILFYIYPGQSMDYVA